MDKNVKIIFGLTIVCAVVAFGRRIIGIGAEVSMEPSKAKWVKRIGWAVEMLLLIAMFGSIVITIKIYGTNEQYIETLKNCTFSGTTDTVGHAFSEFYGNLEWTTENPAERDKNHKYIIMTGQCYREAAMIEEKELVDVKIIFDARKLIDDYYHFKRLYGFVNGEMLNDEEFAALIEDTYGASYDRSDMLDNGVSGLLSGFADLYIDEVNKRLFSGKYISYYDNNANNDTTDTAKESGFDLGEMDGNMQKPAENPKENYEEPETFSGEIVDISDIFASELGEEISWYSDTTGYYMIPCMDGETPTVLFSSENSAVNNSIVFYVEIISIKENDHGGLVCSGPIFRNDGGLTNDNNTVEITWDSFEAIDSPSVRVLGEDQMIDRSMEADDYYYWGPLESSSSDEDTEFIFPDSNLRLLTESDINGKSAEELRIAKNEIYARHGRIFASEDLKEYFASKSWYQGYIPADQFEESVFNQIEKDNIAFIQRYIDNPLSAANDSGYASQGLALNDPQAIPQIPGTYHYYSDPSDRNSLSMELNIDRDGVYVSFNKDGHQEMSSFIVYNMNDQEYVDDTGTVGIYFDDYGKTATYHDSVSGGYNGTYTYLP